MASFIVLRERIHAGVSRRSHCQSRGAQAARWSIWAGTAYRDQDQAEIADLGQQPVQGSLIGYRA
jgi:hypothetical protein